MSKLEKFNQKWRVGCMLSYYDNTDCPYLNKNGLCDNVYNQDKSCNYENCPIKLEEQAMSKEASFQLLVDMCNEVGWNEGIAYLSNIVYQNENLQAELFAGTEKQINEAVKLSKTIIRQNISIAKLKQYERAI